MFESGPVPDPTPLYRVRDGVYAADLLIAAVAEFDLFSWLAGAGSVPAAVLRTALGLAERPADVLLTYCAALRGRLRAGPDRRRGPDPAGRPWPGRPGRRGHR